MSDSVLIGVPTRSSDDIFERPGICAALVRSLETACSLNFINRDLFLRPALCASSRRQSFWRSILVSVVYSAPMCRTSEGAIVDQLGIVFLVRNMSDQKKRWRFRVHRKFS